MCFLSSTAGSQMKCDVDLNLLCIKYTEQTSAFLMLGTAASQNCFQGRLTVCISLVNGLLGVPNGSKMPSLLLISVLDSKTQSQRTQVLENHPRLKSSLDSPQTHTTASTNT